jgi:hypothetical protein
MKPQKKVVTSQAASDPIVLDHMQNPFSASVAVKVTGTLTYTVQHTFDDILNRETPTWFDHPTMVGDTASEDGYYSAPVTAIRLNVTAFTSGSAELVVIQAGD